MLLGTIKHHGTVRTAILCLVVASLMSFFFMASSRLIGPDKASFSAPFDPTQGGQVVSTIESSEFSPREMTVAGSDLAAGRISRPGEHQPPFSRGNNILPHDLEKAQRSYEDRLAHTIETLLERSLGPGKVRARVNVDLDRSRTTENSEVFDPYGQVIRSSQTSASDVFNSAETSRTKESVNYEITKTIRSNVKEAGGVNRLSVAVLVDGTYTMAEDGTRTYAPRPQEEIDQLTRLVQSIVGYDAGRGDKIEIISMQFAELTGAEFIEATAGFMGFTRHEMVRFGETLLLSIMALLVLLVGVRPIVNRLLSSPEATGSRAPAVVNTIPSKGPPNRTDPLAGSPESGKQGGVLERKNIVGRIKSSSIKEVETLIDDNTNQAVSQVRGWLDNG